MIAKPSTLKKGLPKTTESLCPECKKIIIATLFESDGKVMIEKTCPEHGKTSDIYWSDVELYLKAERFAYDGVGVETLQSPKLRFARTSADCANSTSPIPHWQTSTSQTAAI
jgi:uncharacterized radical SAM superfamily Fe-S cluster-containing enzyme